MLKLLEDESATHVN